MRKIEREMREISLIFVSSKIQVVISCWTTRRVVFFFVSGYTNLNDFKDFLNSVNIFKKNHEFITHTFRTAHNTHAEYLCSE